MGDSSQHVLGVIGHRKEVPDVAVRTQEQRVVREKDTDTQTRRRPIFTEKPERTILENNRGTKVNSRFLLFLQNGII